MAFTFPGQPVAWKKPFAVNASKKTIAAPPSPNQRQHAAEASMPTVTSTRAPTRSPR
jgi:hypothetical protein